MTAPLQELGGRAIRVSTFWPALLARLRVSALTGILNSALASAGVYLATDDFSRDERSDGAPWGRVIVIPTTALWPVTDVDPGWHGFGWLVRGEMRIPNPTSDPPGDALGRLQQLTHDRLLNWLPTVGESGLVFRVPPYLYRYADALPDWDDQRKMWLLNSEWRAEASRP
jgi:hypothetical protein